MLIEYIGRLPAIQRAADAMPSPTSPSCRSISRVIRARYSSESVSPRTSDPAGPSSAASRSSPSITPLCAKIRPSRTKGCVFSSLARPVEACRTCATKVVDVISCGSRASTVSARPRIACFTTRGDPSGSKAPAPAPSGGRRAAARGLSTASNNQNVALMGVGPLLIANRWHIGVSSPHLDISRPRRHTLGPDDPRPRKLLFPSA
ncbi:hypothetical protein FAIPA1_70072 [Frankia sp. AiPs1]